MPVLNRLGGQSISLASSLHHFINGVNCGSKNELVPTFHGVAVDKKLQEQFSVPCVSPYPSY